MNCPDKYPVCQAKRTDKTSTYEREWREPHYLVGAKTVALAEPGAPTSINVVDLASTPFGGAA
jgi:hypothetical protein